MKSSLTDKLFGSGSDDYTDRKYGLKTFYEPDKATLDIVFVHGITGHRERTWSVGKGAKPWPETFLPTNLPDARILSFGYDASVIGWRSGISSNGISDHAKNLLVALATRREADNSIRRPIVFVAHSLGGLVCEDAILSSRGNAEHHLQHIFSSTWGILFLGTPHFGTALAPIAKKFANLIKPSTRTNLRVLKVLGRDSEILARIQHDFHSLLRSQTREGYRPIKITCFYEEIPLSGVGEVVPKHSATLPGYTAIGIHSNHQDMVRFTSEADPGFLSIVSELQRWGKEIECLSVEADREIAGAGELSETKNHTKSIQAGSDIGGIIVGGNIIKSNLVSGNQTIYSGLTFGS